MLVSRDVLSDKSREESLCFCICRKSFFYLEDVSTAVTWPPFPCVSSHDLPVVSLCTHFISPFYKDPSPTELRAYSNDLILT